MKEEFLKEFFPQNAFDLEWELSRFHRSKGGDGVSRAVNLIQNFIGESRVLKYPLERTYETWRTPRGWNLKDGFLKIVNGKYIAGSLALSPINAIFLSGKTNGVERLKVVDVGDGENEKDYKKDVRGKAILASGNPSRVYRMAKKFGARCVLSYFMRAQDPYIKRSPELIPDAVNYTAFPVDSDESIFGFALSYNQYVDLKTLAKKNLEIESFMDVDSGTNQLEILEARIGKQGKEKPIILTAHLCHPKPGANDNASGSALLAEIVRVLKKFEINREIIALWIPEMYGTIAYLTDHDHDFEFNINLDMVGEDQDITGSTLDLSSTPWSLPSFINELMAVHLQNPRFRMKEGSYSGGSDHYIFVDSSIGVQAVSLTQWPDRYYHTSEDTPDKASVRSFDWIGRATLESLGDIIDGISKEIAQATASRIFDRFMKYDKDPLVKNWIAFRTYKSLEAFSKYADVKNLMNYVKKEINLDLRSKGVKRFKGPLGDSWMNEKDEEWEFETLKKYPAFRDYKDELLNFLDLGFNFKEAVKIASEEFRIENLHDSEYLVKRLEEEGLIKSVNFR
ncbi:DUF4910 domain-containing protein [Athalassotoga saccharophila]|uniref:DUF4910 domain-containing protein n=1 Tax=Athalassotoga saccharophila TaxID=1441386 RepID=UPI00137AC047|nr:DUF4910 domain-containing protein [Athalassotoga saccharophila]BBJ27240.1 aminopeptidase YwaD [Athalassotoga saccharophila]